MSVYMEHLKNISQESRLEQEETRKVLKSNNQATNSLLENTTGILTRMMAKNEDKTYNDTTQVQNQIAQQIGEDSGGVVHLVTEGVVKYPQEALGFFSLKSNYSKKEAPYHRSVRGWMRPTFVMDIDSMKQRMGLEIYFVLMWQEDHSRVNWTLEDRMTNGSAFSFSPSILQ